MCDWSATCISWKLQQGVSQGLTAETYEQPTQPLHIIFYLRKKATTGVSTSSKCLSAFHCYSLSRHKEKCAPHLCVNLNSLHHLLRPWWHCLNGDVRVHMSNNNWYKSAFVSVTSVNYVVSCVSTASQLQCHSVLLQGLTCICVTATFLRLFLIPFESDIIGSGLRKSLPKHCRYSGRHPHKC